MSARFDCFFATSTCPSFQAQLDFTEKENVIHTILFSNGFILGRSNTMISFVNAIHHNRHIVGNNVLDLHSQPELFNIKHNCLANTRGNQKMFSLSMKTWS